MGECCGFAGDAAILEVGEGGGKAQGPVGEWQAKGPGEPAPHEEGAGFVVMTDVSSEIQEALLFDRLKYLTPERRIRGAPIVAHGDPYEADAGAAFMQIEFECRWYERAYDLRINHIIEKEHAMPFDMQQRIAGNSQ